MDFLFYSTLDSKRLHSVLYVEIRIIRNHFRRCLPTLFVRTAFSSFHSLFAYLNWKFCLYISPQVLFSMFYKSLQVFNWFDRAKIIWILKWCYQLSSIFPFLNLLELLNFNENVSFNLYFYSIYTLSMSYHQHSGPHCVCGHFVIIIEHWDCCSTHISFGLSKMIPVYFSHASRFGSGM
jgi:hypothetical protein